MFLTQVHHTINPTSSWSIATIRLQVLKLISYHKQHKKKIKKRGHVNTQNTKHSLKLWNDPCILHQKKAPHQSNGLWKMERKQGTIDTCNNYYKKNSKGNATPIVPTFFKALWNAKMQKWSFHVKQKTTLKNPSAHDHFRTLSSHF